MRISELDREWWTRFAKWLTLILVAVTLIATARVGYVSWNRILRYATAGSRDASASERKARVVRHVCITLVCGATLAAMSAGAWIVLGKLRRKPRRVTQVPPDADFWEAAWAAVHGRFERATIDADSARTVMGSDSPHRVLGVRDGATRAEIKSAYRKLMSIHHPDKGGDEKLAKRIIAAYSLLIDRGCGE